MLLSAGRRRPLGGAGASAAALEAGAPRPVRARRPDAPRGGARRALLRKTGRSPVDRGCRLRADAIEAIGHVPLPPYIERPDLDLDRDRYQTVFAREPGSIAAPTAGLHFTEGILRSIDAAGVSGPRSRCTWATARSSRFAPPRSRRTRSIPSATRFADAAVRVDAAMDAGRHVVAVARRRRGPSRGRPGGAGAADPGRADTDLFIHPGRRVPRSRGARHQLPLAGLVALDARLGVRRPRTGSCTRTARPSLRLSVLQLRRRDADHLTPRGPARSWGRMLPGGPCRPKEVTSCHSPTRSLICRTSAPTRWRAARARSVPVTSRRVPEGRRSSRARRRPAKRAGRLRFQGRGTGHRAGPRGGRQHLGLGAHIVKTGLSPVLIDLAERGFVSAFATNGAGIIHDFEIAMAGSTSEDVDAALGPGRFGMAEERGQL